MKINKIKIQGNQNISLQEIIDSSVTINVAQSEEMEELIRELYTWQKKDRTLNLLVLTNTLSRIEQIESPEAGEVIPLAHYGVEPQDWKPFGKLSILELIAQYHQASNFKIEALFVDSYPLQDKRHKAAWKDGISPKTVLILDAFSLYFPENKEFVSIFDKREIGACLVPLDQQNKAITRDAKALLTQEALEHLHTSFYEIFEREYTNVELNIPNQELFFRRLTNIAVKCLKIPETFSNLPLPDSIQTNREEFTSFLKSTFE